MFNCFSEIETLTICFQAAMVNYRILEKRVCLLGESRAVVYKVCSRLRYVLISELVVLKYESVN